MSDLLATVPAHTTLDAIQHYAVDVYERPLIDAESKIMRAWHERNHHKHEHIWFRALVEKARFNETRQSRQTSSSSAFNSRIATETIGYDN